MDAIEIIYQLRRLGKSQAQIARELGITGGVVGNVIHDRITAYAVASHIAGLLGLTVEKIWPTRYVFKPRGSIIRPDVQRQNIKQGEVS